MLAFICSFSWFLWAGKAQIKVHGLKNIKIDKCHHSQPCYQAYHQLFKLNWENSQDIKLRTCKKAPFSFPFLNRNEYNYQIKCFITQNFKITKLYVGVRLKQLIFRHLKFLTLQVVCQIWALPIRQAIAPCSNYLYLTKISIFHREHFPSLTHAACRQPSTPNMVLKTWSHFQRILIFLFKNI